MTEQKKRSIFDTPPRAPLYITAEKSRARMTVTLVGISSVTKLSLSEIELMTKAGGVTLRGAELRLTVFESKTVEVTGKIEEVSFSYGKT